jgi:sugar phosphate isomerase/epimerase
MTMKPKTIFTGMLLMLCMLMPLGAQKKTYDSSYAEQLGWRLAAQAYTFRLFTFAETLEKLNELGLKYVEMYPGQVIGGGIEGNTHYSMDTRTQARLKALLESKGIELVNYGVAGANTREEWVMLFRFARDMGIETIAINPQAKFIDLIEELCEEYDIRVAIHNHPKPASNYWSPDLALAALAGRSRKMGICADLGHWGRSGVDPLEAIKISEGRIISIHGKDLNSFARNSHDVPWGAGVCNMAGIMHELKRQGFKGVFSIEYEHNWENSVPEIAESIAYFNRVAYWLTAE